MKRIHGIALAVITLFSSAFGVTPPAGITLVGKGLVPGAALDKSGLTGNICQAGNPANCVPKALFGGFGSALTYTGHNNVYIAAPDRGPFDGLTDVPYLDRIHFLKITTDLDASFPNINVALLDTRLLRNERGQALVGAAGAFDLNNERGALRFDPEGIRVGLLGTFFISDEYGPDVFEFDLFGRLLRRLNVPSKYKISNPSEDPNEELLLNTSGRQANRGMEGLAISPNDRFLFGMMQNALIQDHGLNPGTTDRLGLNNRILKIDLLTGRKQEYVYVLDAINRGQGVSEILAINDHEFLVVERDNRSNLQTPPQAPTRKTIYKIDINGATDVSDVDSLPAGALPADITPVKKTLFIDLLDPTFNLAPTIPEKLEGLAWGPDLPDGRHLLYVISDNDLTPTLDTQLYAFAIPRSLIDFERQFLPLPLYPPWLVPRD
ncbi:MAG TPA: esterase-like activity of phytase family protein [Blastocatellia bacterium]|jgi:hypothetical protein|nr:esterase-like activity of phytase family protein [Blastocatellia bacterium]